MSNLPEFRTVVPEIVLNIESEEIVAKSRKLTASWTYQPLSDWIATKDDYIIGKLVKKKDIRSIEDEWEISKIE